MIVKNFFRAGLAAAALAVALPAVSQAQTKIYIDPGHGGSDPGAVNGTFGTEEADRVLYTGLEFRDYLNEDTADTSGGGSWSTRMSRSTDVFVSLSGRSTDANSWGAARFLSIHQNAFNSSANGTETFSYSSSGTGAALRNKVQEEAIQAWGLVNRGNKTANFSVLRNTSMPSILTEMGFIDAPADHPKCSSDAECTTFALGMLYAVQRHYGLSEHEPVTTVPEYIVDNTDAEFSASASWFTSSWVSGYLGTNYAYRAAAYTSDAATWSVDIDSTDSFEVFARWTTGANRVTSAPFIVYHAGGSTTVTQNQQTNNGTWVSLGTYTMNSGNATRVALSCWTGSGTYVIADGIKLVRQ